MIGHKDGYALVTGATSGIGYELATLLAKDGKNLVIVARDRNRLEQVRTEIEDNYRTRVKMLPKDLSAPQAPLEIFSELEKEAIDVDVLVNNAGLVVYGLFSETDLQKELEMIQLYVSTLTHMTKLFLKKMLENKSGWILNVSSGMAFLPVPLLSVYSAGKALRFKAHCLIGFVVIHRDDLAGVRLMPIPGHWGESVLLPATAWAL